MTGTDRRRIAAGLVALCAAGALHAAPPAGLKMEPVKPTPVAADAAAGKALYERYCVQCHGAEGKGDGPAADLVYPRPRDFTLAIYKVRSTPSGGLPTDHDLFRVISEGLPGTSMPAWKKFLGDAERWQLVHHVKTFDTLEIFKDEAPKEEVSIAGAPAVTPELVARGKAIYQDKKCWQCHGALGRGDGESAEGMKDEWGHPIRPVNFTKGWRYRGGDRIEDIYRTFTTGFNGTPMPSFVDAIPAAEDRWALAAFVKSLTRAPRFGQVLNARAVAGEIPADPDAPAWEAAEFVDFPLAGQIIVKPRWFKPAHDVITARALYNEGEVAVLLEWDDGTHSRGDRGKPADQAAVQFPAAATPADEKPYFVLGDARNPVDTWRWSAAGGLSRFVASGAAKLDARDPGSMRAAGGYKDGQYRVILRRPRKAADAREVEFAPGRFVPIAFQLWDGEQGEEGLKMALSSWYYLLLEPTTPATVYLWPLAVGLLAVGGEVALIRRLRRRKAGA
jgi:DMSO reductase family type II enzyme heme b subunit